MPGIIVRAVDSLIQHALDLHYLLLKDVHQLRAVTYEVTNRCNLKCRHCYAEAGPESDVEELSLRRISEVAEELKVNFGKVFVAITGGEPLVRADLVEILKIFSGKGFPISLSTNALLLTPALAQQISDLVSAVSVSIDGLEHTHNYIRNAEVFQKTLQGITLLRSAGLQYLAVKTTVTSLSLPELSSIEKLVQELEVQQWHLFAFEATGRGTTAKELPLNQGEYQELCTFVNDAKQSGRIRIVFGEEPYVPFGTRVCDYCRYRRCQAGISGLALLPDGSVLDCINSDRSGSRIQGKIGRRPLKEIWENGFVENRRRGYRQCSTHTSHAVDRV
jgi:MoaA/NifB/PqqE/SkfB family radical SAM enzyme